MVPPTMAPVGVGLEAWVDVDEVIGVLVDGVDGIEVVLDITEDVDDVSADEIPGGSCVPVLKPLVPV
jgi:hypothetical protein